MMAENFQQAADSAIFTLNFPSIQSATFPSEKTKQLLVEIQQLMQNQFDMTEEQTIANAAKVGQQQNNADADKNNSTGPPPEDFRLFQVAPREQDFLLCSNAEVYLRKAIIVGPYQDDEHYLDVQFRLMREDLYRPLRDGIAQFRQLQAEAKIAGTNRPPKTDLFIYSGVRLDGMELHKESGGLLNYFQLNKSDRSKRMHKRLMFGALVCLSTDKFQHHYVFGVVVDRDKLEKGGFVGINLFAERATGGRRPPIQFNVDYSMVESPAFYEAYKHVLTALQAFPNGTAIPFSKYFVHLDANVSIPRYLTTIPENAAVLEERDLDFECLLTERAKEIRQQQNAVPPKCKATSIGEHFGAADFGMDQSQFDALVHAIRSDLAVIQGPPGTGKTFLGLKLVQLLFANEEFWASDVPNEPPKRFLNELRRPMLVVCYTNHALDQFLEGMIPFLEGKGIVRVGGRCKNEELEKFTLGKLRAEQRYRIDEVILDSQNRREYYDCREQLQKILKSREYWKKACHEPGWILEGRHLRDAAGEVEINENFEELIDSRTQFRMWLGQAKKEANQMEMDVDFVRMLFSQKGMNELEAWALAFMAAGNLELKQLICHQESLTRKMWNQMMRTIHQDRKFIEETQHWPKLQKLDEFGSIFGAKPLIKDENGITILCTYVEQMFDVRSRMKTAFPAPASKKGDQTAQTKSIRVDVVDNYQGEECDIIILSLVRSNHPEGKIGFLNIPNRVCVAMSRAKLGFFVLGNFDYLSENCHGIQKDLWSGIRQSMVEQNAIGRALPIVCKLHGQKQEIEKASEFMEKSPEGGCCRPCDGRLDCGHTCDKLCHAYDIDHTKSNCYKKCTRMCENGLHQSCQLLCYEECTKCTEIVEKTLKCGHRTNAECWIPIELIICQEKCTKTLTCFHECKGFCSAPCPPCNVLTLKILPCKHQKTMECSKSVATITCKVPVKKCWPVCGHLVETKCNVNPENVPCPNPCVKIVKEGEEENDGECTHPCKGTCGQCRNGRLHIECSEECKRILICDHLCGSKCSSGCPPCDRPCETRCGHSQCSLLASEQTGEKQQKIRKWDKQKKAHKGRRCGELCPPCQEPCLNECPHRKCSKRCSEPCDVGPCNEPCAKRLKCTPELSEDGIEDPNLPVHLCAGMCSEKCIEICRICEPEKFQEQIVEYLLFGEEDEPDAHFVQLQDCGHYVEVKALDKWVMEKVEQGNEEADRQIIQIPCPKCKTPIRRSKRYISLLNKRAMEIEQVKMKIIGSKSKTKLMEQWTVKQKEMVAWLKEWIDSMSGHLTFMHIGQRIIDIRNRIENYPKVNVTAQWMDFTLKNIENFLSKVKNLEEKVRKECPAVITDWMKELAEFKINAYDVQSYMHRDLTNLMERISACPGGALHLITAATFARLSSELGRNEFMLKLFTFLKKVPPPKASLPVAAKPNGNFIGAASPSVSDPAQLVENVLEILHKLHGQTQFIDIHAKMEERLKMLADKFGIAGLGIGVQEFLQIHHAFGGNMGQWYVCSKGHPYNIDNCGGAMARGRCPECHEVVGGADHRLVGTSQQANELTAILENADPRMRQPYNPFVVRYH